MFLLSWKDGSVEKGLLSLLSPVGCCVELVFMLVEDRCVALLVLSLGSNCVEPAPVNGEGDCVKLVVCLEDDCVELIVVSLEGGCVELALMAVDMDGCELLVLSVKAGCVKLPLLL